MKILTITNSPLDPTLGSGKTVLRFSEGLRQLGHQVTVLEPRDYEPARSVGRGKRLRQSLGAWKRLSRELSNDKFDLVEFYGAEFWLAISKLAAGKDHPLLVEHTNGLELLHYQRERSYLPGPKTIPESLRRALFGRLLEPLMRLSFAKTDCFVSLCQADRDFVVNAGLYDRGHTEVVEPGLDDEFLDMPEPGEENRQDTVVYVGSWTERKGLNILTRVMTEILTCNPQVDFLIHGAHAAPHTVLSGFPAQLHNRIFVESEVSNKDLADALSKCKVFFFPTQYEGYGMALAEAMSCGCAAVTTPTGLGAELQDGREALICNFEAAGEMVSAIERLLADQTMRISIARQGWKRTRVLDWPFNVKKLEQTYLSWLDRS